MPNSNIASRWKELSGENDWNGLLDPLDHDLRRYIIHYGQRAGSVSDVYKDNIYQELPNDKFFEKACLEKGNDFKYKVVHYFDAGYGIVSRTWFGFVAVTTDAGKDALGRRDILIIWRGTRGISEWFNNANIMTRPATELFGEGTGAKVHSGFLNLYMNARDKVRNAVRESLNRYRDEETSITVAGFSLGGALATLNAMDIVANGHNMRITTDCRKVPCMVTAFTYGNPRVGTIGLKQEFDTLARCGYLRLLRIKNTNDIVTVTPPLSSYQHVGTELIISSNLSKYLKKSSIGREYEEEHVPNDRELKELFGDNTDKGILGDLVADKLSAHNMDVYLHLIALGEDGSRLVADHDIALVNKYLDSLKDEYNVPPRWWDGENRAKMVQQENGHWKVVTRGNQRGLALGTKRALLVGCNYNRTKFSLQGCINDVIDVKDLIENDYGFKQENVKVLTDEEGSSPDLPTHENIMKALDDMVTKAKAGDELLFHFSGHGTIIPSLEPGKPYTEGEAIVPCDLNLITNMDLRHIIQRLEPGTRFTILSDSCHSGGLIDKDKEQIGPHKQRGIPLENLDYQCKDRFLPVASIISGLTSILGIADNVVTGVTGNNIVGHLGNALTAIFKKDVSIEFRPNDQRSLKRKSLNEDEGLLLSGCQANETSADVSGNGDKPHGAFTNAVLHVLKKHKGEGGGAVTNKELVKETRSYLKEQGFEQNPCLYSNDENANEPFLGNNETSTAP